MSTDQITRIAGLLGELHLSAKTATIPGPRLVVGPRDAALRDARTCYDHLAGRLGVAITQRLVSDGGLVLDEERESLTDRGMRALAELGSTCHQALRAVRESIIALPALR